MNKSSKVNKSSSLPSSPVNNRKATESMANPPSSPSSFPQPDVQPDNMMPSINQKRNKRTLMKVHPMETNAKPKPKSTALHLPPASASKNPKRERVSPTKMNKALSTDSVFNEALKNNNSVDFDKLMAMNFIEAYKILPQLSSEILKIKNLICEKMITASSFMNKFAEADIPKSISFTWSQHLIDHGIAKLYCRLWDQFWTQCTAHNWIKKSFGDEESFRALRLITIIGDVIVFCTDESSQLGHQFHNLKMPARFVQGLQKMRPDVTNLSLSLYREWYLGVITICSNILRQYPACASQFREQGLVQLLVELANHYSSTTDTEMRAIIACCIAYIVNDEDIDALKTAATAINLLIGNQLRGAISRESRRSEDEFGVEEILLAIKTLAAVDSVKKDLVEDKNNFSVLQTIYKQEQTWEELILITQLFWTLSFDERCRTKIVEHWPNFTRHLQRMDATKVKGTSKEGQFDIVMKNVQGTLWNYGHKGPNVLMKQDSAKPSNRIMKPKQAYDGQIMISYDWRHQSLILRLNKRLKAAGLNTWIDVERMCSTLEAMAEAVQQSAAVIVCISDEYKESPSCRAEAEYAFRLNKAIVPVRTQIGYKPDGWLGILIGTKLYFNCVDNNKIDENSDKIVHEITKHLKGVDIPPAKHAIIKPSGATSLSTSKRSSIASSAGGELKNMGKDQVQQWLVEHNLSQLCQSLVEFDGATLHRLFVVFQTCPKSIIDILGPPHLTFHLINCLENAF